MPSRPRVDVHIEEQNLQQKQRLKYILEKYAPSSLRGVELYRQIGLTAAGQGAKAPSRKGRPLPEEFSRVLPTISEKDFGYLLETDTSKRAAGRYLPSKALTKNLRNALGWVIADAYEGWPQPLEEKDLREKCDQISNSLSYGTPQPAEIFHGVKKQWAEEFTTALRGEVSDHRHCTSFLRGMARPGLNIANAGATIARSVEATLLQEIEYAPQRAVLLTSAAGDGKSTLLYRLGQNLFDRGWRVLFKHESLFDATLNWPIGKDERTETVLFIDRAEGLHGDLQSLYSWLHENPKLRIVLAAREIDWLTRGFPLQSNRHVHVSLPRLNDREIDDLAALIMKYGASDQPVPADALRERLRHSVHETEYPHMLAAVMTASRGSDFTDLLRNMVQSFPNKDLLKWTALCASGSGADGFPTYATHRMMSALFCDNAESLEIGAGRFGAEHRKVSSEIVGIHGSRYDLRHPDITNFVLRCIYDADGNGVLRQVTELEDDLHKILRAVLRVRLHTELRIRKGIPDRYLYEILRSWWLSPSAPRDAVGRQLYEDAYERLGNLSADRRLRANLLRGWMAMERNVELADDGAIEAQRAWLPKLVEILSEAYRAASDDEQQASISEELYNAFKVSVDFALRRNELGALEDPAPYSARHLLRSMWNWDGGRMRGTHLIDAWSNLEGMGDGLGAISHPEPYTIRWLFRQIWHEKKHLTPGMMYRWAHLEARARNFGGDMREPPDYSARWVFRQSWTEENREQLCNAEVMVRWALTEADMKPPNLGNPDAPAEFTARWILRQAWRAWKEENLERLCDAQLIVRWAQMETETQPPNLGDPAAPAEFTARWIFRQAWRAWKEENREALCNGQLIVRWAQMETEAQPPNLGDPAAPAEFTARWIFRQAWKAWKEENRGRLCNAQLMIQWAQMETEGQPPNLGDPGDPAEFTARWIFRQSWKEENRGRLCNAEAMLRWAQMEAEAKPANLGDPVNPAEFTARWIFRQSWQKENRERLCNAEAMLRWAQMEAEAKPSNLGDPVNPAEFTARWIFRQSWREENRERLRNAEAMLRWAQMEAEAKPSNLGDPVNPAEFTARWIFRQSWKKENRERLFNAEAMLRWAQIEAEAEPPNLGNPADPAEFTARWIFRQAWKDKDRQQLCNAELTIRWAQLEANAKSPNLGTTENPDEFTARWIFRQVWKSEKLCNQNTMLEWANIEAKAQPNNLGKLDDPAEFTARWIFRQAWREENRGRLSNAQLMVRWAQMETEAQPPNLGDPNDPAEFTARWVAERCAHERSRYYLLGIIAVKEGNFGTFENPKPGTARFIFRELHEQGLTGHIRIWARSELDTTDSPRGEHTKFTADWLFELWRKSTGNADVKTVHEWILGETK